MVPTTYSITHEGNKYAYTAIASRDETGTWHTCVKEVSSLFTDDGDGNYGWYPYRQVVADHQPIPHLSTTTNSSNPQVIGLIDLRSVLKNALRARNWAVLAGHTFVHRPGTRCWEAGLALPNAATHPNADTHALLVRTTARLAAHLPASAKPLITPQQLIETQELLHGTTNPGLIAHHILTHQKSALTIRK